MLIRGSTPRMNNETERSIHDALCVVRDIIQEPKVVAGGSAPEVEIAKELRKYSETLPGKEQLAVKAFAESLEVIATTLSENAGLDPINVLSELRSRHEKGEIWAGIEVLSGKPQDMSEAGVFEPITVKKQMLKSAADAAMLIIRIDDVIAAQKMKSPPMPEGGGMPPGMVAVWAAWVVEWGILITTTIQNNVSVGPPKVTRFESSNSWRGSLQISIVRPSLSMLMTYLKSH